MSRELSSGPPSLADGHRARGNPGTAETPATPPDVAHGSAAAGDGRPRADVVTIEEQHERARRFSSPARPRLGPVECTLLALIALGIAITTVMAIVNP